MRVYKAIEKAMPIIVLATSSVFGLLGNVGSAVAGIAVYMLFVEVDKVMGGSE